MAKAPPAALLSALTAIRGGLQRLRQATVPAGVAVLELGFGAWLAQARYVAVRMGIADQLLSRAGFRLQRVVPTTSPMAIIAARPV